MSYRSNVLELLKKEDLTSKEIQERLGGDNKLIQVYLNEFKKENKIKKIGNKGKFFIWKAVESIESKTDPTEIAKLKGKLKVYHTLFEKIIDKHFSALSDDIIEYIEKHNEFSEGV